MLKGIDISVYQPSVDFALLKTDADFVIIRASYGVGYIDKCFASHQSQARSVGLLVGYYHYAYPQYNKPEDEADWFLKTVGSVQEGEILCLDFEENWNGDVVTWCKQFLDRISNRLNGYKSLIYLNKSLSQRYDWSAVSSNYNLWAAHYDFDMEKVNFTNQWPKIAIKQYTDSGQVSGINGHVDEDIFFGSREEFLNLGYQAPNLQPIVEVPHVDFVSSLKKRNFLLPVGASVLPIFDSKHLFWIMAPIITLIIVEGLLDLWLRARRSA